MGRSKALRFAARLLIGFWHALLQLSVPFLLIRRGSYLTWLVAAILILGFAYLGQLLLQANRRGWLALVWIAFGLIMLALPYVTTVSRLLWSAEPPTEGLLGDLLSQPFYEAFWEEPRWSGWAGLFPSFVAGLVGAVMSCVWFGWYLAVCFAFNGHNNEVGGAARIEDFGQFIRFRLTENDLTAYVIGFSRAEPKGEDLKPHIIDAFRLTVKPATPA